MTAGVTPIAVPGRPHARTTTTGTQHLVQPGRLGRWSRELIGVSPHVHLTQLHFLRTIGDPHDLILLFPLHLNEELFEFRGVDLFCALAEFGLDSSIDSQHQAGDASAFLFPADLPSLFLIRDGGDHGVDQLRFEPGRIRFASFGRIGRLQDQRVTSQSFFSHESIGREVSLLEEGRFQDWHHSGEFFHGQSGAAPSLFTGVDCFLTLQQIADLPETPDRIGLIPEVRALSR
ncbi:MAG TPA: hypothetical protein DDY91_21870 [Planctomycetaceae bacterium]|nr:hypothetical protein [Planctomycetaceae bacterium]